MVEGGFSEDKGTDTSVLSCAGRGESRTSDDGVSVDADVDGRRPCFKRSDCCRGGMAARAFNVARLNNPCVLLGGSVDAEEVALVVFDMGTETGVDGGSKSVLPSVAPVAAGVAGEDWGLLTAFASTVDITMAESVAKGGILKECAFAIGKGGGGRLEFNAGGFAGCTVEVDGFVDSCFVDADDEGGGTGAALLGCDKVEDLDREAVGGPVCIADPDT